MIISENINSSWRRLIKLDNVGKSLVSVVMITYNHQKYIAEAIRSVLNQTFHNFELVIVNDGSTDKTDEIIRGFEDNRINYIFQENQGPSSAINTAIKNSKGKYIAIMSGDDVCYPERLSLQLEEYQKGNARLLFSHVDFIDDDSFPITPGPIYKDLFNHPNKSREAILNYFFFNGNYLCTTTAFTEKQIFNKTGLFDPRLLQLQDFDMWIRALIEDYEIQIMPQKLLRYRIRNGDGNLSAPSKESTIRTDNEYRWVLRNFLNIKNLDDLRRIFPQLKEKAYEVPQGKVIPYLVSRLAMESGSELQREFGLESLFNVLDEKSLVFLKKTFNFKIRDFYRESGIEHALTSQLYVDSGDGFSEPASIKKFINLEKDKFNLIFKLDAFPVVKSMRFIPVKQHSCKSKIDRITIEDDRKTNVLGPSDFINILEHNGSMNGDGFILFETMNPQITLHLPGLIRQISLEGALIISDNPVEELDKRNREIENINQRLNRYERILHGKIHASSLYLNTGKGFNEKERLEKELDSEKGHFDIAFDLSYFKGISEIRFDPFERYWGKVRIDEIVCGANKGFKKCIDLSAVRSNGSPCADGFTLFETHDPMFYFPVKTDLQDIRIKGEFEVLDYSVADGNHAGLKRYVNEIREITESRRFRWCSKIDDNIKKILPAGSKRRNIIKEILKIERVLNEKKRG